MLDTTSTRLSANLRLAILATVVAVVLPLFASCAASPPYRTLLRTDAHCDERYQAARWNEGAAPKNSDTELARIQKLIRTDRKDTQVSGCWNTSYEHHATYDLYSVEFDDQGWLAHTSAGPVPDETQLTVLMNGLNALTRGRGAPDGRPLSVVIYTHGWHHSAAPDDENVVAFRRLLEEASTVERELCLAKRSGQPVAAESAPPEVCSENEAAPVWEKKRRVVGIYIGWRGDSVVGPVIEMSSIWDRKLAAETVALGSVQELYARMHSFYVEHECHSSKHQRADAKELADCADVRMLTVGHSFGGLITYRALAPRMMQGVAETAPDVFDSRLRYAYGFGDLTVLINPAFEATRFEPLAEAAASRLYIESSSGKSAQLPFLIIATSKTDRATGSAFPIFRWVTTRFERATGAEREANVDAVGWDPRYRTHSITLSSAPDVCGLASHTTMAERLFAEARWSEQQQINMYAGFGDKILDLCDSLRLLREPTWALKRPAFMPLWVIHADKTVIDGHNDFLNSHFVDFVRQVYYTILREEDLVMRKRITESP